MGTEMDDMTDVLERTKLSSTLSEEEKHRFQSPLSTIEQLFLLCRCQYLWGSSNPNDEMLLEEVNALAQRVLMTHDLEAMDKPKVRFDQGDGIPEKEEGDPILTANWLNFS